MIKIIEIEVGHNKRLRSGLIENILYKPESPYQVIVGPNGVGKSALLEEITAFPSPKSSFEKDGISRAIFETDDGIIETKSIVQGSTRHEFWKGGENLNTGGTANVQKDLVLTHLKMTDLSFELATNKLSFSTMAPAKRQEILSQLANNDMTYAYNLFIKAKKKLSHAIGARNALEDSLVEKQVTDITDEEVAALESRLEDYNKQAMELLTELQDSDMQYPLPSGEDWVNLSQGTDRILRAMPRTPLNASERSEYVERLNAVEFTIRDIKTQHRVLQEQYDGLDDVIKRSADSSDENIAIRRQEVTHWTNQLNEIANVALFSPNIYGREAHFAQIRKEVASIWDGWRETVGAMEPDTEDAFTRANFTQFKADKERYQIHMNSLVLKRSRYLEQLEHLEKGVKVNCPGCGLFFVPGTEKNTEARIRGALNELGVSIEKGEVAIQEVSDKLARIENWVQQHREMLSFEKVCPSAVPFFSEISRRCNVKQQPTQAILIAADLFEDLRILEQREFLEGKLADAKSTLFQLEANSVQGLGDVIAQHRGMQLKIEETTRKLKEQESLYRNLSVELALVDNYQGQVEKHTQSYATLLTRSQSAITALFNDVRRTLIKDLQGHIGTLSKTLSNIKSLRDQIADTEKQLKKQRELIVGYTHLVEGLSPKTGVVAEQMVGFIEAFVGQMNKVIERVWTYEMEVMPGFSSDGDITYNFPLQLHGDASRLIPDIKESSDGQKGFLDFAFKITAMLYLNQVNVPLLLDEVDRPLGPIHKERLMRFITEAVENGRFSQVFLISHHVSSHGALPYPDTVDFDFRNPQPESNRVAFFQ